MDSEKAYVNDGHYIDVVTRDGSTYACKTSHTSGDTWEENKWMMLCPEGSSREQKAIQEQRENPEKKVILVQKGEPGTPGQMEKMGTM